MNEEEELKLAWKELELTKLMLLRTKVALLLNLIISISMFALGFYTSYKITELQGFGFISSVFLGCGLSGVYFFAKTTLLFQELFEKEQKTKTVERKLQNCFKELQEKQRQ